MNSDVEKIARALLYEGITLYPYRNSALKNQQRFNFGALLPQEFCEAARCGDTWFQQTQCLLRTSENSRLASSIRFLQLHENAVLERECNLPATPIITSSQTHSFCFQGDENLCAEITFAIEKLGDKLCKITLRNQNVTAMNTAKFSSREAALSSGMLSVHSILTVENGAWISLLEPPDELQEIAASCENIGVWPVLAGNESQNNTMLSSPIILYDYPQIAPESAGDYFDGLEIDELMTLRILTLTEEEKLAMRESDERAREILARTESLPMEKVLKLHGAWRSRK